jgi:hypothetical protein
MANTITVSKNVIALSAMDSDYQWTENLPSHVHGIPVFAITFTAGITSNNTLVLRNGSLTGPAFFKVVLAANAFETFLFGGALLQLCMEYTDCTFTSGATWSFLFGH